jgi:hypothetical protein
MNRLFLVSVAALFLATGTAHERTPFQMNVLWRIRFGPSAVAGYFGQKIPDANRCPPSGGAGCRDSPHFDELRLCNLPSQLVLSRLQRDRHRHARSI